MFRVEIYSTWVIASLGVHIFPITEKNKNNSHNEEQYIHTHTHTHIYVYVNVSIYRHICMYVNLVGVIMKCY